jgi:uncharacterized membrane protein
MKNDTSVEKPETQTIALLAGLSIGLGLAVHEVFFLVAAGVLLIRPVKRLERYVYELTDQTYEKLLQNGQRCLYATFSSRRQRERLRKIAGVHAVAEQK